MARWRAASARQERFLQRTNDENSACAFSTAEPSGALVLIHLPSLGTDSVLRKTYVESKLPKLQNYLRIQRCREPVYAAPKDYQESVCRLNVDAAT